MPLTNTNEESLRLFVRNIRRRILALKRIDAEECRILMNLEIWNLTEGEDVLKFVKGHILRWFGHVQRRDFEAGI